MGGAAGPAAPCSSLLQAAHRPPRCIACVRLMRAFDTNFDCVAAADLFACAHESTHHADTWYCRGPPPRAHVHLFRCIVPISSLCLSNTASHQGFEGVDQQLLGVAAECGWCDGATAVAAWLVGSVCLVANVGDAKAVLARVSDKVRACRQRIGHCTATNQRTRAHARSPALQARLRRWC